MLSITTDYIIDHGDPSPYLRRIADAGFTHIHWCHHWRSDFLYAKPEIDQIRQWLHEYGLTLNDVHGSEGIEKFWYSSKEYARLAGVELVQNRIDFAAELGGDAIVMHVYPEPRDAEQNQLFWGQLRKTLDAIQPYALERGVRIAVENLIDFAGVKAGIVAMDMADDNFDTIEKLFALYPPEFLGTCYDSGHGHLGYDRMERLDAVKDRLYCLHLHDNDSTSDDHRLVFQDAIRWDRLAELIAHSVYAKPLSLEVSIHKTGIESETEFLQKSLET
ncbi:MAG: sugar phosphate isomerase/epimerase family protein, partial [Chloroflexota bacterium]